MKCLGHEKTEEAVNSMLHQIDKNMSQQIDFDEFKHLMVQLTKENESEEALVETFRCFDTDARGYIDVDELMQFLKILRIQKEDKNGGMKDMD